MSEADGHDHDHDAPKVSIFRDITPEKKTLLRTNVSLTDL